MKGQGLQACNPETEAIGRRPRPLGGPIHIPLHIDQDYTSSARDVVEFYNLRGGKERIFDDMNNGFGWNRLPKSFMAENTAFLLLTALIRNFYKGIMAKIDVKDFGLKATSRIKAFVFKFISVPAKRGQDRKATRAQCLYRQSCLRRTIPGSLWLMLQIFINSVLPQAASWGKGQLCTSAAI